MALALGFAPPKASAVAPAGFVGMQSYVDPTEQRLRQLQGARVGTYRIQMNWESVEPVKPDCNPRPCTHKPYRWGRYDGVFKMAAKRGIRMVPFLLGTPPWATTCHNAAHPPMTDDHRASFTRFAKAAAERYGPRSAFWRNQGIDGAKYGAKYWQVWNEANLKNFWHNGRDKCTSNGHGRPNPAEYAALVKKVHPALIAGDPTVQTTLGGFPYSDKGTEPNAFLRGMFQAHPDIYKYFSAAAVHAYATTPSRAIEYGVAPFRRTLDSLRGQYSGGGAHKYKEIYVTEVGWATGTPDGRFQVSEALQASNLREFYSRIVNVKNQWGILGAVWFNLQDTPGSWWATNTGLIRENGSFKPSWNALKCTTGAGGC